MGVTRRKRQARRLGAAIVTPVVTKWAIEGTSLQVGSYAVQGALDSLVQTYQNFAVGGSSTASMTDRLSTVAAASCNGALLGSGAPNDLMTFGSAAAALAAYLAYAQALKTAVGGGPVGIIAIPPLDEVRNSKTGFNARRRTVNDGMRAFCAANFGYFYCPAGEHPLTAYDDAANLAANGGTGDYESDGLHPANPSTTTAKEAEAIYAAVSAIIAQAGQVPAANPASFTLADVGGAALGSVQTYRTMLTGLGMGKQATGHVSSGPGTFARGYGSFDASDKQMMAGDVLSVRVTASAVNSTLLSTVYAVGDKSDQWDVTSAAANPPVWTANDYVAQSGQSAATAHTMNMTAPGAGRLVVFLYPDDLYSAVAPSGVTCKLGAGSAVAMTMIAHDGYLGSVWISASGQEATAGQATEIVATWPATCTNMHYHLACATHMTDWVLTGGSIYGVGSRVDGHPQTPATITVAPGNTGLAFAGINNVYGYDGQTIVDITGTEGSGQAQIVTTSVGDWRPGFSSGSGGLSWIFGLAFGPP